MLLQRALGELDAELEKLTRIRKIVQGLASSPGPEDASLQNLPTALLAAAHGSTASAPGAQPQAQPVAASVEQRTVQVTRVAPKRAPQTLRAPRRTREAVAPRALGGVIPARPVVVRAAEAANGRVPSMRPAPLPRAPEPPPVGEGTLEALVRELTQRQRLVQ